MFMSEKRHEINQQGVARPDPLFMQPALGTYGTREHTEKWDKLKRQMADGGILMMGENPDLPKMPQRPTLVDFFKLRFAPYISEHMLQSAQMARSAGMTEKMVMACLLHDIAVAGLISADHGYWGAQLIEPYVDEEVTCAPPSTAALFCGRVRRIRIPGGIRKVLWPQLHASVLHSEGI
jgi:hypothetical protein